MTSRSSAQAAAVRKEVHKHSGAVREVVDSIPAKYFLNQPATVIQQNKDEINSYKVKSDTLISI